MRSPSKLFASTLRNNPKFQVLFWAALTVLLLAGMWSYIYINLAKERQLAIGEGNVQTARLARDYSDAVRRTVQSVDHALLVVKWEYERHNDAIRIVELAARGLIPPSNDMVMLLANASGQIRPTTGSELRAPSDRADLRKNPFGATDYAADSIQIEDEAFEPMLGQQAVRISRQLIAPDGSYAGAAIAAVPIADFMSLFDTEQGWGGWFVNLVGMDGETRVHYGAPTRHLKSLDRRILHEGAGAQWVAATVDAPEPYYLAWKHVESAPLVVVVGRSEDDILGSFLEERALALRGGTMTSVLLVLFGFAAAWLSARLAARSRQELATRAAYRSASDVALDGFFILDAMRDHDGAAQAFTVVDCNQRAAELLGFTREDLIGHELSEIMAEDVAASTTAFYARILASGKGSALHEFVPKRGSPLKADWVAHQVIPTERGVAVTFRDISATKAHARTLEDMARIDSLTGLPNRRWLMENLPGVISACAEKKAKAALLFIDLDDFKTVNDTLGHAAGDRLLEAVAKRVRAAIRDADVLCRLGGDEFTVILGTIESADEAAAISQRILAAIQRPFNLAGHEASVGSSIGISLYPADGLDADTLVRHADLATYRAKELGKQSVQFFAPDLSAEVEQRRVLEEELRRAIERNEFVLAYQPKMAASEARVIGLEALIRWNSPTRGRVMPAEFIDIAEQSGLICRIGAMVLEMVCRQLAEWRARGFAPLPVSINVSPCQLGRTDVAGDIQAALARHDLPGTLLEVEITEASIMEQPELAREKLLPLRALGVRIAMDGFGTGYSGLAHLAYLDVAVVKIDRTFIENVANSPRTRALVEAVVALGAALGLEVIAEGVETSAQLGSLASAGCDHIQGYFFSKPVEAGDVQATIQALQKPAAESKTGAAA
jgi:diguanylate cyclase (GGDEF)-like protein/PAS domain S-box-containing protein